MQKPSVSRDVHYTDSVHGGPLAAKVTAVHEDGTVDLTVFPPHEVAVKTGFVFTVTHVPCGPGAAEPAPGCWNWPPRV
jgi:hypothetical protein